MDTISLNRKLYSGIWLEHVIKSTLNSVACHHNHHHRVKQCMSRLHCLYLADISVFGRQDVCTSVVGIPLPFVVGKLTDESELFMPVVMSLCHGIQQN